MKPACSRLFGLLLAVFASTAQGKTSMVEWDGGKVPQLSSAQQIIFSATAPVKSDGRFLKLLAAIAGHQLSKPDNWDELVEKVSNERGDAAKLATANRLINQIPFIDGTDGSWFSPVKFFRRGGVCKDYVVAKSLLLKAAGFTSPLRIISMTPRLNHQDEALHVALVALPAPDLTPVVLDIKPLAERRAMVRKKGNPEAVITDIDPTPGDDPRPLSSYGNRGLLWAGNESGVVPLK